LEGEGEKEPVEEESGRRMEKRERNTH